MRLYRMAEKTIDISNKGHVHRKWDNDQYICELEKIHNGNIISLEVFAEKAIWIY